MQVQFDPRKKTLVPPQYQPIPAPQVAVALIFRTVIGLTNPWKELGAHLRDFQLPSLDLLIRCIKTLAQAIFRHHFNDGAFLVIGDPNQQKIYFHGDGVKKAATPIEYSKITSTFHLESADYFQIVQDKIDVNSKAWEDVSLAALRPNLKLFASYAPEDLITWLDSGMKTPLFSNDTRDPIWKIWHHDGFHPISKEKIQSAWPHFFPKPTADK